MPFWPRQIKLALYMGPTGAGEPEQLSVLLVSDSEMIEIASDKELFTQTALAEFAALRSEVLQAFSMQWNTVALQLTTTGVLVSFSLTSHARTGFLLIVPVISYILNGRYLRSERLILTAATYIMTELSPRVPGGLNWEEWLRRRPNPNQYLRWLAHGPPIFSAISLVALAWLIPYILSVGKISGFDRTMLILIWVFDFSLIAVSIYTTKVILGIRLRKRGAGSR